MTDSLEHRGREALRRAFEPLATSLEYQSNGSRWTVTIGRDARFAGGLTLASYCDTIHEAVARALDVLRHAGRAVVVSQVTAATGGRAIDLPSDWTRRRVPTPVRRRRRGVA